jgi:hypothetical protein
MERPNSIWSWEGAYVLVTCSGTRARKRQSNATEELTPHFVSPAFGGYYPRWQNALGAAANAGLLCCGPDQGNEVTFVRADQWLDGWRTLDE